MLQNFIKLNKEKVMITPKDSENFACGYEYMNPMNTGRPPALLVHRLMEKTHTGETKLVWAFLFSKKLVRARCVGFYPPTI